MSEIKRNAVAIGLVAILVAIGGAYFSYDAIEKQKYFRDNGKTIQAVVVGKNRDYDEGWSYWVEFAFTDEQGGKFEGWYDIDAAAYKKLVTAQSRVPVIYLPENPEAQMSPAQLASKVFEMLLIGSALFGFLGIGLQIFAFFF